MSVILLILIVILVIANLIAFYKVERLVKINKGWFPFFHLVIWYLILWLISFFVSLFFSLTSAWFVDQSERNVLIAGWWFTNQWKINVWIIEAWQDDDTNSARKMFIQSFIFYVLSLIGMFLPLVYFTYLLTRLAWLKWYFAILWIPIINIFYYPYLFLRISKKFKKGLGSALLLLFFFIIYFPILILKNEKNYIWVDKPLNLSWKEIWIMYWIMALLFGSWIIINKSLENKYISSQADARDIVRKIAINQLSTNLERYFFDKDEIPPSLNKLTPTYISYIPKDPLTHKLYFYKRIDKEGLSNGWFILWAPMENPKNCNISAYSKQELEKIVRKSNNDVSNIKKLINKNRNYYKWCYYVITN